MQVDICQACDYIIWKTKDEGVLTTAKLQMLLYYIQAWHIAFFAELLFEDDFVATQDGVSCPRIETYLKNSSGVINKSHYSSLSFETFIEEYQWSKKNIKFIDNIFEVHYSCAEPVLREAIKKDSAWEEAWENKNNHIIDNQILGENYADLIVVKPKVVRQSIKHPKPSNTDE